MQNFNHISPASIGSDPSMNMQNVAQHEQKASNMQSANTLPTNFKTNQNLTEPITSSMEINSKQPGSSQGCFDSIIKRDHAEIYELHQKFMSSTNEEKEALANSIIRALSIHCVAEEAVIYPLYVRYYPNGKLLADRARDEHLSIKESLYHLDKMDRHDTLFASKLNSIVQDFKKHAMEEERCELPGMRNAMNLTEAEKLGRDFEGKKASAPSRPHPSVSNKGGILESMASFLTKPIDALKDKSRPFEG